MGCRISFPDHTLVPITNSFVLMANPPLADLPVGDPRGQVFCWKDHNINGFINTSEENSDITPVGPHVTLPATRTYGEPDHEQ